MRLRVMTSAVLGAGLALSLATTSYAKPPVGPGISGGIHVDAVAPDVAPVNSWERTRAWGVENYIAAWEQTNGRTMTDNERRSLSRGCIGVSVVNFERGNINPPLGLSFGTFGPAKAVEVALNDILATKPTRSQYYEAVYNHPLLGRLDNVTSALPYGSTPGDLTAVIFSKRFYSNQNSSWTEEEVANAYLPDAETGQVDMSTYQYKARSGYVNFDYGWYDEKTNNWWHANHSEPGMKVYQSTLNYYSRPLLDFDRQVFSVTFAKKSSWASLT